MREYFTPTMEDEPSVANLTEEVFARGEREPDRVVCHRHEGPGRWAPVSASRLCQDVRRWAGAMLAAGLDPGDRVAVLGRTSYEWTVLDLAIWSVGAVSVPLYDTSSASQVADIVHDCAARAILVQAPGHATLVTEVRSRCPELEHVWPFDVEEPLDGTDAPPVNDSPASVLEERRRSVTGDSLATLVYTSGATGDPRGCRLTHDNLLFESSAVGQVLDDVISGEDPATLLVLPLAHVLARVMQVTALRRGVRIGYTPDLHRLLDDVRDFEPTFVLGVPRILEKIFTLYSQRIAAEGRGRRFESAAQTAIAYSTALESDQRPGRLLRGRHRLYERSVYADFRRALGGRMICLLSGGAPLGDRLGHFYRGAGLPALEGYGLTETTGASTVASPDDVRVGRVGRPLPGTGVRVSDEGELLVVGPHVFDGYWRTPTGENATKLGDDGWLRTGDLGEIDGDGSVRVTGRTREIIVTAGGKNVAPGPLEEAVRAHPLVDQCVVVGDDRPFIAALVTLDPDALRGWSRQRDKPEAPEALGDDSELRTQVQAAIDLANQQVSQAEAIRAFRILPDVWSDQSGELTPSLKLRRGAILRAYRRQIEDLYRS